MDSMTALVIRKAAPPDVKRLAKLKLLLQQHGEKSNPSIWRITEEGKALLKQRVEDAFMDTNTHILVAEMNKKIIGFIQGEVSRRTDYSPKNVGHISTIYVVEKFRRRGVGLRLVKGLCKFFDSEGVEHVTLRLIIGNREGEGFWRKLGFEPVIITAGTRLRTLT